MRRDDGRHFSAIFLTPVIPAEVGVQRLCFVGGWRAAQLPVMILIGRLRRWHCAYRYIVYKLFRTHTLQFLGIGGTDYAVERKYEDG